MNNNLVKISIIFLTIITITLSVTHLVNRKFSTLIPGGIMLILNILLISASLIILTNYNDISVSKEKYIYVAPGQEPEYIPWDSPKAQAII